MTIADLKEEIVAQLTKELADEPLFSESSLDAKVSNAIMEMRMKRNYSATSYTEDQIADDLYNYYSTIANVALYDYNKIGTEGEKSRTENSISQTWEDRDSLFQGVHAFVKVF